MTPSHIHTVTEICALPPLGGGMRAYFYDFLFWALERNPSKCLINS